MIFPKIRASCSEGYTFFEIALAIGIIAIVFVATIPVVSASYQERKLRNAMDAISNYIQEARFDTEKLGKEQTIIIRTNGLAMREGDDLVSKAILPGDMKLFVRYPQGDWEEARDQIWRIFSSGLVAPLSLRLKSESAWLESDFDFLTGSVSEERYSF